MEAILTAAEQVLRRGDTASMRAIARRAGVGVSSIYDYFRDRDVLLRSVVDRLTVYNDERLAAEWDGTADNVPDAVDAMVVATFALYFESPGLTRTAVRTIVVAGMANRIVAARDAFVTRLCRTVEAHAVLDPPVLHRRALALADMLFGIILAELHRSPDPDRRAHLMESTRRLVRAEVSEWFDGQPAPARSGTAR